MALPKKYPVFRCREVIVKDGRKDLAVWKFWCPFCKREHMHSAERGHREAHCHDGSPFRNGGYYLVKEPKARRAV